MDGIVRRKLETRQASDPWERAEDPWAAFRAIEIIDFPLSFRLRHSLGKLSRFFLALEQQRLLATRCPHCGTVWMPPRVICGDDRTTTEWVELSGRGTLAVAGLSGYGQSGGEAGAMFGYVALEGASTMLFQRIRGLDPAAPRACLPVKAVWAAGPVDHPMELFWFEPA